MLNKRIQKSALLFVGAGVLGTAAYATCSCANFTQTSLTQLGAGFLAQASYYDGGCQGWTLARYSNSGTDLLCDRVIKGRLCSNGQTDTIAEHQEFDDYILAENYWNLSAPDTHDKGRCKVIHDSDQQAQAVVDP